MMWTDGSLGLQERIKTGDVRDNSKINPDALMHRFYGVANIDGVDYRVMTLMKEENKAKRCNDIHSYEVQKSKCSTKKRRTLRMVATRLKSML